MSYITNEENNNNSVINTTDENDILSNLGVIINKIDEEIASLPIQGVKIISRPLIKGVLRHALHPYIFSLAFKYCQKFHRELYSLLSSIKKSAPNIAELTADKNGLFSYFYIQELSLKWLKSLLSCSIPKSLGQNYWNSNLFEAYASLNLRRRQEDRYFYVPDVYNYSLIPSDKPSNLSHPTVAFGVFDGHGGPEVAEHCSHLAPFLISKYIQQLNKSYYLKSIPDVMASVFRDINQSVLEGHKSDIWKGGSTCTMCIIHDGYIYTAWVGDSQAWLVFDHSNPVPMSNSMSQLNPNSLYPGDHEMLLQNISNFDEDVDLNYDECMPLTDMLHRPSNVEEFVSVTRTGGLITYERTLERATLNGGLQGASAADFHRRLLAATLLVPSEEQLEAGRVSGQLGVTRSFGDEHTLQGTHALPSITACRLDIQQKKLLGVVVASDGMWDVAGCTGPTIGAICRGWSIGPERPGLAELLVRRAEARKSTDNITVVFANLRVLNSHAPIRSQTPTDQPPASLLSKQVLWPLGNRSASQLDLASASQGNIRGPNDFVDFGINAKRIEHGVRRQGRRSISCSSALEKWESVSISSPMRVLEIE